MTCYDMIILCQQEANLSLGQPTVLPHNYSDCCYKVNSNLQLFSRYWSLSISGSRVWPFGGTRDVIGHSTIWFPVGHFLMVVRWNQAANSNSFSDIQWRIWRNGWHDLKLHLNKGHVILFVTNRIDFSYTPTYWMSLCSRTHCLATIHNVTDKWQQTYCYYGLFTVG